MLITPEKTDNVLRAKYFTITAGKEGKLEGVEPKELLELAMELVDNLSFSQITTLYNKVDDVWCAKKDRNYVEEAEKQVAAMLEDLRKLRELL